MIIAAIVDRTGGDSIGIELCGYIVLIVSASALQKATMRSINYGACALGGVVAILISFVLDNGSGALLVGTIVLIITSIKYIKSFDVHNQISSCGVLRGPHSFPCCVDLIIFRCPDKWVCGEWEMW